MNDEREVGEFERSAYEFARQWATGLNRRQLLKSFGISGATAAALLAAPRLTSAAPGAGQSKFISRGQDASAIKIGRGQLSDTLDPHKSTLLVAHEIMWQIYDSLIYLDSTGTVLPGAATEWTFSDDSLSITFKLRENVKFHDGTPLDAQAVKDTVARMLDPATASPNVGMLGPLDSVNVIDPLTVEYKFKSIFSPIFVGLGFSYCAPISTTAAAKTDVDFGRNPVGTGPYKFVEWTQDDTITLEKNDEHDWSTPYYKVQQPPQIGKVSFVVIPDDATRLAAMTSGEVDIVAGTDAVPIDKINALKDQPGYSVVTAPVTGVYYLNLNHKMKPFDDLKVRQAVSYAIDRQSIVDLVLGGNGTPAVSLLASAFGDFNKDVEPYTYDPDKAKSLLKEAGLEGGFKTTYLNIEPPALFTRAAEIIQQNLADVGITFEMQSFPVAQWVSEGNSGKYGISFSYYTYNDPDVLYVLAHSGQFFNFSWPTGMADADVTGANTFDDALDTLLDQQRGTFDHDQRHQFLLDAQKQINDQAHYVMLWETVQAALVRDGVTGVTVDLVGFIHLQELGITS